MKKEITAEYMHQLMKDSLFKNVDLSRVPQMTGEELRSFTLEQTDAIWGLRAYGDAMGWLVGQFIEDDGSEREDNPLYEERGKNALTDWYLQLVELGADLYFHHSFDLDKLEPGLAQHHKEYYEDFTIDNERLVEWLRKTPYRRVAAMVARIMLELEFAKVIRKDDAIQDYYAENCDTTWLDVQKTDQCDKIINDILHATETMKLHRQKGRELGLSDEQRCMVDILWGWAPHDFDEEYVAAAKEVVDAVNEALPDKTFIRSDNAFKVFKEALMPKLVAIVEKYELGLDLTDQYNLTMGYMNEWLYRKYMGDLLNDEFFDE